MSVTVEDMASTIAKSMEEYASLVNTSMKAAVVNTGKLAKSEITKTAPKATGRYARSWLVKKVKETYNSLQVTVYSRKKYMLAHLLENGHAKRNGGRVAGKKHIKPAEDKAVARLEQEIARALRG